MRRNKRTQLTVSLVDTETESFPQRPSRRPTQRVSRRPRKRMDLRKMRKMESLLTEIGGESLSKRVLKYDERKTRKRIIERIEKAAEEKCDETRFVETLKSVEIVGDQKDDDDFWTKYGIRCRLTLDLDFEETVTENEELFGEKMTAEIASILDVDASLIRIDSTEKGSVIVTVTLCAICAIFLFFAGWKKTKISFPIKKSVEEVVDGEMLLAVDPGDEVFVDWKDEQYTATVLEKKVNAQSGWITVHYQGDPFMFVNTETLPLSSPRLHLKEPGSVYEACLYPDEGGNLAIDVSEVSPVAEARYYESPGSA